LAHNSGLETIGEPRFRELTELLVQYFEDDVLWDSFGVASGVTVSIIMSTTHAKCLNITRPAVYITVSSG
jgi:hypothetical protein